VDGTSPPPTRKRRRNHGAGASRASKPDPRMIERRSSRVPNTRWDHSLEPAGERLAGHWKGHAGPPRKGQPEESSSSPEVQARKAFRREAGGRRTGGCWPTRRSPIIGLRTMDQLTGSLRSLESISTRER
jgi:hypothetical protein